MLKRLKYALPLIAFACLSASCSSKENSSQNEWPYGEYETIIEKEDYFYSPSGRRLHGYTYCPGGLEDEKLPSVILAHGLNSRALSLRVDCRALTAKGFRCFAYDFCGGVTGTLSDGSFDELTIDSEITDYFDIWNHVTSNSLVDMNNLFVFGASFGGPITTIAKTVYNLQPKAAILEYPALSFTEDTPAHLEEIGAPSTLIESIKPYIGDFENKYLTKFDINTLILHGTNDTMVDISVSENALKYMPNATLKVVDGAGHTFGIKENQNVVWPAIVDFLISNYN